MCLAFLFGISAGANAQIAPDEASLKHQWTFDDGTANDVVGDLNGTLMDGAKITNNALNLATGGYLELNAAELAINTYGALTVEGWYTSVANANGSYHMLYYFGGQDGNNGTNYTCVTPARGNNQSRGMISVSGVAGETGVNGPEYDDGLLHHMVCVIDNLQLSFYIDGMLMNTITLPQENMLSGVASTLAYFGKGGFKNDPTFRAFIHKLSVYDAALTSDNISYLYNQGPESNASITPSITSIALDNKYYAKTITVSGIALTENISITTPAHITVTPTSLPANAANAELTIMFDELAEATGDIVLTSGGAEAKIAVKAVMDTQCFQALYPDLTNIIEDAGLNDLSKFGGWGQKSVVNIVDNPELVYCGANSIQIGTPEFRGSLDYPLNGMLLPSTTYRLKCAVKTSARYNMAIERFDGNNKMLIPLNTNGEWQVIDTTFSTGASFPDNPVLYMNNWDGDGGQLGVAYIDNWELYVSPDKKIVPTIKSLAFDNTALTDEFLVTANNLEGDIVITAPAGITVAPATLTFDASVASVSVTYDGTTVVDGDILLKSGDIEARIKVKSTSDATCYVAASADNLVDEPHMNSLATFAARSAVKVVNIVDEPANVYCGAKAIQVGNMKNTDSGFLDYSLTGLLTPNTAYHVKFAAKTDGRFTMGVEHIDLNGINEGKLIIPVSTNNEWQIVEFDFTTGAELPTAPIIYFNNWPGDGATGTVAFIDNWEIYQYTEPVITVSKTAMAFDDQYMLDELVISAANLTQDITVTAPAGISVEATLPSSVSSYAVSIGYDGTTAVDGFVEFTSSNKTVKVKVKSASNDCYDNSDQEYTNLIPDPYFTDKVNFRGWGTWNIVSILESDSVFCGSRCGKITTRGNFEVPLSGMLIPNTVYESKIMLRTLGGAFRMGINSHDLAFTGGIDPSYPRDYVDSVDTHGEWTEYKFQFTTGVEVGETPVIFFNNDHQQGKIAYLDNWQVRQKYPTAIANPTESFASIFVQNGKVVAEFDANESAQARISVYNIQGALLADELFNANSGRNRKVVGASLKSGIYIIKLTADGKTSYRKLVM